MKPIQIGDIVGDYRVIEAAGAGGMGAVYKIEHIITRRIEAMKILPPSSSSDPDQIQRFEREIQVQARLHHPNIVALYNAIRDGASTALVMEFVEGESLQRKLEAGPLPVAAAVDYAIQVLRALAYAHDNGVIHRDVAPANIIITPDRVAKLTDFGLARGAADLRLSASGVPVGSPWYMSPEQVKAVGPMDARTDIYATGAVLHEMLTGTKLFDADGAFAVMRAHVEATPALPSSRNAGIPKALDEIVAKAVAKDPATRFQSADEFRLALQQALPASLPVPVPSVRRRGMSILMILAPAALVASVIIVREIATSPRLHAPESQPKAVPVAKQEPSPPPPPPVAVAADPVPLPEPEKPAPVVRRRGASSAQMSRKSDKSFALRITGGDPVPATPPPAVPAPAPRAEEPAVPPAAETVEPPSATVAAAEPPAPQEAAPAKSPSVGSRLVKALGRVNPFHKTPKPAPSDPAKAPLKQ
uniref:non-specific serine/threonine protein kinase n=1 Tax=Solibacter usitatus (strain Ellin6076) TaxID=234267 RepID=Q01S38_SOLUE